MFSADGVILATAPENEMLQLWESKSGHFMGTGDLWFFRDLLPSRHFSGLFSIMKHTQSDIYYLALTSSDSNPLFWFPPEMTPESLALNPTCFTLAVGCFEGQVLFLDVSRIVPP